MQQVKVLQKHTQGFKLWCVCVSIRMWWQHVCVRTQVITDPVMFAQMLMCLFKASVSDSQLITGWMSAGSWPSSMGGLFSCCLFLLLPSPPSSSSSSSSLNTLLLQEEQPGSQDICVCLCVQNNACHTETSVVSSQLCWGSGRHSSGPCHRKEKTFVRFIKLIYDICLVCPQS